MKAGQQRVRAQLDICTLCSCYPWPVLASLLVQRSGVPSRACREPHAGGVRCADSSRERSTGLGQQRADPLVCHSEIGEYRQLNEAQLVALVTPEAMMGVALVPAPPAV